MFLAALLGLLVLCSDWRLLPAEYYANLEPWDRERKQLLVDGTDWLQKTATQFNEWAHSLQ